MANSKYADYWRKKEQEKNFTSGEQKTTSKYDYYWAKKFSEQLPSLINRLDIQRNELYKEYNTRFFDENGNYINTYRGGKEGLDAWNNFDTKRTSLHNEYMAIAKNFLKYKEYYDKDTIKEIENYLHGNLENLSNMWDTYNQDYNYWSQWDSEETYNSWMLKKEQLQNQTDAGLAGLNKVTPSTITATDIPALIPQLTPNLTVPSINTESISTSNSILRDNLPNTYAPSKNAGTTFLDDIIVNNDNNQVIDSDSKYFQSGTFSDGYQFGDITRAGLGTAIDIGENLGVGLLGISEKTTDTVATFLGFLANKFGYNDFAKQMEELVEYDLIDEEGAIKGITNFFSPHRNPITEKDSFLGEKMDSNVQSVGQMLGQKVLQSGLGIPWWLTTGLTSFGSESEQALREGADFDSAVVSGLISAGGEILSEKLFGRSMLGEKGIFDLDKLTKGISNKVLEKLVNFGLDLTSEGIEEVFSSVCSRAGSTLYKEENVFEILTSEEALEEYLDSFIGGMLIGGVSNVGKTVVGIDDAIKSNRFYGQYVLDNNSVDTLVNQAKNIGSKRLKRLADKTAGVFSTEGMSKSQLDRYTRQIGDLYQGIESIKSENTRNLVKEELKAHNADTSAETIDVILKYARGEKLTEAEQTVFDENKGAYVLDNIVYKMAQKSSKPTTETVNGINADTFEGATENTVENDFKQTTYNGEAVSFKYKSADAIELDNGETVSVEDITMSDDDAVFYDAIMGENDFFPEGRFVNGKLTSGVNIPTANAIRKIFGGTPTINQLKGVKMYYHYGMYNIRHFGESGALTESQERQVFNLGRALSESVAEKESSTPKVKKYSKGKVKYNVKSELSSRQQASVEVIEKLADMFNITFNLYESTLNENGERSSVMPNGEKTSANGYYMNGEIYVDINAGNNGQGAVLYTVAHELTHYIREGSPKKFKVLADFLVEQYEGKGKSVDYYVNKQMEKARKSGNKNMKYSEAFEEFVADSMEKMLTDQNAVEKLAMLRIKDKSVFDKLREGIQKLVDRIKQEYAKITPDSAEGRTVATMTDVFNDIQDLFLEALDDASNNFQKAEKNTITNDGVQYSEREIIGLSGKNYGVGVYLDSNLLTGLTEDERKEMVKEFVLSELSGEHFIAYDNDNNVVDIKIATKSDAFKNQSGKKHKVLKELYRKHIDKEIKQETVVLIDELIANAKYDLSKKPNYSHEWLDNYGKSDWDYWTVFIQEKNKSVWEATLNIANTANGEKILYDVDPIKKVEGAIKSAPTTTNNSLSQEKHIVNNNSMQETRKNSLRDSNGRELSPEQAEFFKDSKVVDKNGSLRVMYHGTNVAFTTFDIRKSGVGAFGKGFYFSPSKANTTAYGDKNILEVYLNIKNPYYADNIGFDYDDYADMQKQFGINEKITDNNVNKILQQQGYDGVIASINDSLKEIVAFNSNQIKNVDNVNPTSNDDIRFSERSAVQIDYEEITKSFNITKPNDYVHVQRQVFDTLKNEGFFTDEDKNSRIDYNEDSGMVVETNKSGIKETFNFANFIRLGKTKKAIKLATIRKLPEIIKNGKLVDNDVKNYHNDNSSTKFTYIQSTVDVDGNNVLVKIDIKKSPQKNKFWVHRIDILEKANELPAVASRAIKQANDSSAYEDSVPNTNEDVKENLVKFSERGQSVYKLLGENQRLQKENERLKEKVKYLNDFVKLQRKITHGKIIDRRSTEAQARKIKKSTGSKIELSNLTDQLYAFYTLIIGSEDLVWDTVFTRASWIANDILNEVPESTQRDEYAQEILSYIRSKNIRLNDVQRAEVENIYDSYNAYRKRLMGSITISQKGTSLDSVWQDLAEQYPDTFSKDTNPADMPLELADIIHTLRNSYEVIEEFDKTEQVRWLAEQIYDTYWDVSTVESVMDKLSKEHQQQINALKMQHAERVKKIYAKHQEDLKEQRAYYQEMYKRLRERATASHKKQMLDYQDKVHEAQAKAIEKRNNTETRRQILKTLDKIDARLSHPTKEKNIGLEMQPLACRLLTLANLDTVDADYRIERLNIEMENTTNPQVLNTLQTRIDNITKQGEKKAAELQQKRNKYKAIAADAQKSLQEMGKTVEIDEVIDKTLKDIEVLVGGTPIRRMTSYQLECLKNAVNMVDGYIRADKQLFIDGKNQDVENMAQIVIHEVLGNSKKEKQFIKQLEWLNKFGWSMLKPETAFDLIGSSALSHLFQEARKGDDKFARSFSAAQIFLSENVKKYGADKWNMEERKEFMIQDEKVTLTLGEILSLYAYSKRDQAIPHLESGGFVQVEPVKKKIGGKINIEYTVYEDHAHRISEVELGSIINILTKEQIEFADVMQEYLSTVMGAKGNEISRELYQIDLFKEKFYFPLKLSSVYKFFKKNENSKTPMLKNAGMTKPTVTNANDPIVLESFENVWANHVVQMSRYNAYVLGIENLTKVFGYTGIDKSSVRAALQGTYGDAAIKYLENFIIDLNGGRKGMSHNDMVNIAANLMSTFKKVTVSASLSTAIQQPSSIIRAMSYVKPKYFVMRKEEKISHKENWEELKRYAPIAILKEIGGYDMSLGANVADFIKHRDYKGKERFTALVKDSNYRDDLLMWGASKADELAWSTLWHAVKKEQRYRFPNMEKEKFLKICGQRFTDIATKTQVYDSVFTRSEIMRSPSEINKMATSFMGEPMTNLNIIIDSVIQAKRGKITRPQAVWNISCVYIAQISAAALASIVYAMHDDDDESFVEKYMSAFGNKVSDEILPITWIPYVRDFYSLCQGYDVSRTDMSVLSDLVESFQNLTNNNISLDEKITGVSGSVAAMFGVPLKNVIRDGKAVVNTIEMMFDNYAADWDDISKAFVEGISGEKTMSDVNEYLAKDKTDKANELISDLLEEKIEKNISNGKSREKAEKDAKSSIRSSLTSYWKPLFIKAYQEDDYIEQEEIYNRLLATGIYGSAEELKETIEKWVKDLE